VGQAGGPGEHFEQIRIPESDGDASLLDQPEDFVRVRRVGDDHRPACEEEVV
jgi:hypothetical protein